MLDFEVRQEEGAMIAVGTPILYGVETLLWQGSAMEERETIMPGAARNSLINDDQRAIWNHDQAIVLGRKSANTLILNETAEGVNVEILFPDTQEGLSKFESIRRGDIREMSFGFDILRSREESERSDDIIIYRTFIEELKLWEVSPVTFPAYPTTSIEARAQRHMDELAAARRSAEWQKGHIERKAQLRKITIGGLYA